ncbi:DUF1853 family protein [Oceanicoccus sagamiensis]|uniref:DUF1853 domain-containing protein n=1 Tax=Oceanicoccus sagamiensis TaxID=716816 RepID=A0A1X9NMB9_9GAMM|nr:DUF1853 family protein [Oceanicoccus sagamiensis]ARN75947.1 hypothetical protein BST96_18710 [Oceanicoccus sagamiensis]
MVNLPLFETPCVRDLAWSCFGENLINDFALLDSNTSVQCCHISLTETRVQWLQQLDNTPAPLLDHLNKLHSTRIGIYFEALWQFFIEHDPKLELIAHNLQVNQDKKTYGEFDLIYKDNDNGQHYHLELAIKFYLNNSLAANHNNFSTDFYYWLGPNAIDRLDLKTDHLLTHQTQLGFSEAGKAALSTLGIDQVTPEIALKGRLFYPQNHTAEASPEVLSPAHNFSQWIYLSALQDITDLAEYWIILKRSEWISPYDGSESTLADKIIHYTALTTALEQQFSSNKQPIVICGLEQKKGFYREKTRYFITADCWPR